VVSESDKDRRLAEATMKRLTGGDEIKARPMCQDFVRFTPSHTPILVTNHLPKVSGDDPALWGRVRVVPFNVVIPEPDRDPQLPEQLQLEADAVQSWAVAGYRDYVERSGLADPPAVRAATDNYQRDSDAIRRFLGECCFENAHMHVTTGALYERWSRWATDDGAEVVSRKAFGQSLDRLGFPAGPGGRAGGQRQGIGLAAENTEDEE
jgi:putative DNA primase/helicase